MRTCPPPTPLKILTCPHSPSRTHRWKHTCSNNESAWNSSRQAGGSGRHDGFCEAQQTVGKKKITQGLQKLQRRQKQEKHMWWRRTEGRRMLGSCWTPGFWCSKILERWRLTLPAKVHHVFSFLKDLDWRFTNKEHSLFLCSQIGYKLFPSQQNLNSKISHWGCSCSSNFKSHQPERPLTFTFMRLWPNFKKRGGGGCPVMMHASPLCITVSFLTDRHSRAWNEGSPQATSPLVTDKEMTQQLLLLSF